MPIPRNKAGLPPPEEPNDAVPPLPPKPKRVMLLDDDNAQQAWDAYDQTLIMADRDHDLAEKAYDAVRQQKYSERKKK